jgi:DNA modification methylase
MTKAPNHIRELKQDGANARKHNPRNVAMIERSIQENGFGRSLLLANDGTIIAGNATYESAASAGFENVRVIESDGTEIIAIKRTDVEPGSEQFYKLAISDNRAAELASWDLEALQQVFDAGVDSGEFWFPEELATLFGEPVIAPGLTDPDAVPEAPKEPITKPGDLWLLGKHRLLCGDSTVVTDVERLMNGEKADMVFTDPPYGMNLDTDFSTIKGSLGSPDGAKGTQGNTYSRVIGDDKDYDPSFLMTLFGYVSEQFWFGADYYAELIPNRKDGSWLVWDKRKDSQAGAIGAEFELIWSKQKHKRRMLRHDWFGFLSSENTADARNRVHPTQKPVTLLVDILTQWGTGCEMVIDLYGGSGSTLIACEQTGRRCAMMEIDPQYVDVCVKRWELYSGQTATLESRAD